MKKTYIYDVHFLSNVDEPTQEACLNQKYDSPLNIGEEIEVAWSKQTFEVKRILRCSDITIVIVAETEYLSSDQ